MTRIADYQPLPEHDQQFPSAFIQQCGALILRNDDGAVLIGLTDTGDLALRWQIQRYFSDLADAPERIEFQSIDNGELASLIHRMATLKYSEFESDASLDKSEALDRLANNAPIINLVNGIILEAIRQKASDIHIEKQKTTSVVRFRLDGILAVHRELPANIFPSIATRIKIMAGLNIMESRRPQDGRITVTLSGSALDIRVSAVPTAYGESLVLRILNLAGAPRELTDIGFSDAQLSELLRSSSSTQGMLLFTGPTGSGKSTTLSALISRLNDGKKKIITIEDPVEFEIHGVDQIQTHEEIGLSFSKILRRILRQDPDIIMVGEIRDEETAELCIRAAMTGHLVLSSLHTNTAISSIQRLLDMRIKPFLLASVLKLLTAQRLIRCLCPECRVKADVQTISEVQRAISRITPDRDVSKLPLDQIHASSAEGCSACNYQGYKGRTVVSEMVSVDEQLAALIEHDSSNRQKMEAYLRSFGFRGLASDALEKVLSGITSYREVADQILVNV
jgi:general secretion pathway protein E